MSRWIAIGLIGLVAGNAAAQRTAPPPPDKAGLPHERTFRTHTVPTSRDLFRACDGDGDDRLDVFECCKALDAVRDAKDSAGFAHLDQDRDGFVGWPEFDAAFRSAMQNGGTFRVRLARRFMPSSPQPQSATPLQQFLQLHDGNHSGGLDAGEVEKLLRQGSMPTGLGGQLRTLDLDRSGEIDESELAAWFEQLPGATRSPSDRKAARSPLPPPWGEVDADADGQIDAAELAQLLRAIDPTLSRWSDNLLRALDRDKDGKLQPAEIASAQAPTAAAAVVPGQLPKQTPLR
jgi:Ca2+-binding EF-hand superfamily protein